jgi:hypothetical protein
MSPSKDYEFATIWQLEAPIEEIWGEISHPTRWPGWWKGVESVTELRPGDEKGVGSLHRCVWKSRLPYELAFDIRATRVESPVAVEGVARGSWKVQAAGGSLMKTGLRPCAIRGRYVRRNPG